MRPLFYLSDTALELFLRYRVSFQNARSLT